MSPTKDAATNAFLYNDLCRLTSISKFDGICKRVFDIIFSIVILASLSPLLILICLVIPIESPGLPIYTQWRRGRFGKSFRIYKFRSMKRGSHGIRAVMVKDTCDDQIIFKFEQDPRVTRFGRFLRMYSLDELPQLFNVLKGDMSLVGPRPFSVEIFERRMAVVPEFEYWNLRRHSIRPGITGLWQVCGRNDLPPSELIRLDLEYVSKSGFIMDMLIALKTLPVVLGKKGAY
jgi:lipopolysaccharide/colanic/teichoic acid biosynthesis glycosyltransferase